MFLATLSGCGGGGGGGVGSSVIPDFTNTFQGFDAQSERISLTVFPDTASQNQMSGTFDATQSGLTVYVGTTMTTSPTVPVSGTFSGNTFVLNLTNPPPPLASTYNGTFSDLDTMVLTGTGSTLTLRRSGGNFTANAAGTWTGQDPFRSFWLIQLGLGAGYDSTDQTFLIQGAELLNGVTSSVTGYVSVRYVELHIARATGTVVVTGQFPSSSGTVNGDSLLFGSGGSLARGGTPDTRSAYFIGSNPNPALFKVDLLGLRQTQISSSSGPDAYVWGYAVSPDGSHAAYTASASYGDLPQIFLYTAASGTTVQLTGFGAGSDFSAPVWSADSSQIAFLTPATTGAVRSLYIEKIGTNNPIPVSGAHSYFSAYAWSPDSTQIAYIADQDTVTQHELWVVGADGNNWRKLSALLPIPTANVIDDWSWSPHGGVIAFRAAGTLAGIIELYSVNASTGTIQHVSPLLASPAPATAVYLFQWSPDGSRLAFAENLASGTRFDTYTAFPDGSGLQYLSGIVATLLAPVSFSNPIYWSPDSKNVAFTYDRATSFIKDLYVAPADGHVPGRQVSDAGAGSVGIVDAVSWSPDSSRLLYPIPPAAMMAGYADWVVAKADGTTRSNLRTQGLDYCGDQPAAWAPDGTLVTYVAQTSATSPCNVMASAPDGTGPRTLSNSFRADAAVQEVIWLNDQNRLLYLTDTDQPSSFVSTLGLYVAYAQGSAGLKISTIPGDPLAVIDPVSR
jgi:Tol biopolymer transport system component